MIQNQNTYYYIVMTLATPRPGLSMHENYNTDADNARDAPTVNLKLGSKLETNRTKRRKNRTNVLQWLEILPTRWSKVAVERGKMHI